MFVVHVPHSEVCVLVVALEQMLVWCGRECASAVMVGGGGGGGSIFGVIVADMLIHGCCCCCLERGR